MKPGQAKLRRTSGVLSLIVCDERSNVPMGEVDFAGHGLLHQITMSDGLIVPVVELVLRLITGDGERVYRAFVNELEEGIMESLATLPEITVVLKSPKGDTFGTSPLANPFKATANESLGVISGLADKPWNGAHFATARAFVLAKDN
ncbi:MAG: hypothetical protein IAF94_10515 [Pirellulaceae bacterium]|nr:hypothetical protein [Pirellulaceae bacterium]